MKLTASDLCKLYPPLDYTMAETLLIMYEGGKLDAYNEEMRNAPLQQVEGHNVVSSITVENNVTDKEKQ